jgi:hypothetical protein
VNPARIPFFFYGTLKSKRSSSSATAASSSEQTVFPITGICNVLLVYVGGARSCHATAAARRKLPNLLFAKKVAFDSNCLKKSTV